MSSEALERAHAWLQQFIDAANYYGVTSENGRHAAALLAEVARLEQENERAHRYTRLQARLKCEAIEREEAAEAALAAAREREQRLREALQEALNCKGPFNGTVSMYGGDPAICTRCTERARAALVDEPAAAGEIRGRPVKESARQPARGSDTPTGAAPDEPAAATLAEPDDKPCVAQDGPSAPQTAASGSASTAADEPGETPA